MAIIGEASWPEDREAKSAGEDRDLLFPEEDSLRSSTLT